MAIFRYKLLVSDSERQLIKQKIIELSSSQHADVPTNVVPREHVQNELLSNFDSSTPNISQQQNLVNGGGVAENVSTQAEPLRFAATGEIASDKANDVFGRLAKGEKVSVEEMNVIPEIVLVRNIKRASLDTSKFDTEERAILRKKVAETVNNYGSAVQTTVDGKPVMAYNGDIRQDKRADIVIGLPASGKSSTLVDPLSEKYKATGRMLKRFFTDGRFLDPSLMTKYGNKPTQVYNAIKELEGYIDGYSKYTNDVEYGQEPQLIERSQDIPNDGGNDGGRPNGGLRGNTSGGESRNGERGTSQASLVSRNPTITTEIKDTSSEVSFDLDDKAEQSDIETELKGVNPITDITPITATKTAKRDEDVARVANALTETGKNKQTVKDAFEEASRQVHRSFVDSGNEFARLGEDCKGHISVPYV